MPAAGEAAHDAAVVGIARGPAVAAEEAAHEAAAAGACGCWPHAADVAAALAEVDPAPAGIQATLHVDDQQTQRDLVKGGYGLGNQCAGMKEQQRPST